MPVQISPESLISTAVRSTSATFPLHIDTIERFIQVFSGVGARLAGEAHEQFQDRITTFGYNILNICTDPDNIHSVFQRGYNDEIEVNWAAYSQKCKAYCYKQADNAKRLKDQTIPEASG